MVDGIIKKIIKIIILLVIPVCGIIILCYQNINIKNDVEKTLVINELVAKNLSGLTNEDGETVDWIEIYNASSEAINMNMYTITDDVNKKDKAQFQDYILESGEYVIVLADGDEGIDDLGYIHVKFSLNSDGGKVAIYRNEEIIDLLEYPKLQYDLSYGRRLSNLDETGIFAYLTPGKQNPDDFLVNDVYDDLGSVYFSQDGGLYDEEFELSLYTDDIGTQIVYTLDGSEPTVESKVYTEPILIRERTADANKYTVAKCMADLQYGVYNVGLDYGINNVFKGTVVRARILKNGKLGNEITTNTYLVNSSYSMPVVSVSINEDEMFDETEGIYMLGLYAKRLRDIGNKSFWTKGNYASDKAISAHVEYYDTDGKCLFDTEGKIEISGGWSSAFSQQKTLKFSWEDSVQLDGIFDTGYQYNSFKLKGPGGGEIYPTLYQDVYVENFIYGENVGTYEGDFCIVFINGEYWGIYALTETKDKSYFYNHYNVENLVCGSWLGIFAVRYGDETDLDEYSRLYADISSKDFSEYDNYISIQNKIDIESFMNVIIAESFFCNIDGIRYGDHNMYMWRSSDLDETNIYADGKFRWMIYDFDATMNTINEPYMDENTIENILNYQISENTNFTLMLFQKLWESKEFRRLFCETYIEKLSTLYTRDNLISAFESHTEKLEVEMEENLSRLEIGKNKFYNITVEEGSSFDWYFNSTMEEFYRDKNLVLQWLDQRTEVMMQYLEEYLEELEDYD
jgi:hypothetical protein